MFFPRSGQLLSLYHSGVSVEKDNAIINIPCTMHGTFYSLVSNQVMAQPASEAMEVITVSATPINIDDAGSSVSVISRQDILDRNAGSVQDLLREVPGFSVSQQGSHGAVAQVRIRGGEANQVLVLINGIEVNDLAQGSEFDFSQISTNDIERIEIVRGPQSALWGSDAMAGVIHIITMPNTDHGSFDASIESGSFSTQRATFSANHGLFSPPGKVFC